MCSWLTPEWYSQVCFVVEIDATITQGAGLCIQIKTGGSYEFR
jgi:hypothetical protein